MITVFYANLVYDRFFSWSTTEFKELCLNSEIYNGAFVYDDVVSHLATGDATQWYRMDGTPYPEELIDGRMKAWLLLLGE